MFYPGRHKLHGVFCPSGVTKQRGIFCPGWQFYVRCFVWGVKNGMGFFVLECFVLNSLTGHLRLMDCLKLALVLNQSDHVHC